MGCTWRTSGNRGPGRQVCRGHDEDENVITIEIRGHEPAAVEAAQRISELFRSSGPCRLRRTPGEAEVQVLVYADVHRSSDEGGYLAPAEEADDADVFLR
ncbi:hypothetical protein [Streptomyces erythrochromogenes]|uniref:hypothetical protein n=1 Tax=Streptomyces erythrochromogenes TaxID=285574 RepID=UPI0038645638|nr:hypothetical protein OG364_00260 [Streptomyces erythrochromogenes]WST98477.1 hypothetical protein OG364_41275 [Streptomyces erythrochromogenes]